MNIKDPEVRAAAIEDFQNRVDERGLLQRATPDNALLYKMAKHNNGLTQQARVKG